jgi:hypothetical protein
VREERRANRQILVRFNMRDPDPARTSRALPLARNPDRLQSSDSDFAPNGQISYRGDLRKANIEANARQTPSVLYNVRARIEQMMGKIKRFKRIALRCEKTARNYASFLALVCGSILIKSVHTA